MNDTSKQPGYRAIAIPALLLLTLNGAAARAEDSPTAMPYKAGTECATALAAEIEQAFTTRQAMVEESREAHWLSFASPDLKTKREDVDKEWRKLANTPVVVSPAPKVAATAGDKVGDAVTEATKAVEQAAKDMAKLHELWTALGNPDTATADFLLARRRIADCADRVFATATVNARVPGAMASDQPEGAAAAFGLAAARRDYVFLAHEQNYDEAQFTLFTGPTLALNGDDKFRTGYEVSGLFEGGAGSFMGRGRTFAEFNYQTKGSVNVAADNGALPPPGADELFREDKGVLRFNVGLSTAIGETHRYSLFTSAGLSTIPGVGGDFPQALRPRYAVGLLGRVFISEGFYTRLAMSVAHDEYWRTATGSTPETLRTINAYERGVVEAVVLIPSLSTSGVTLAGRLGLDTPLDGKGPSEVRLSVLASVNFGEFLQKIIKLPPAPTQ